MEIQKSISDIELTKSFNIGTKKGQRVLNRSIKELGCCRSIVVDRNDKIICGNKVYAAAKNAGIQNVRIIESTGNELIVVKRTDIDYDTRKAKEISLVDNLTNELGLDYDTDYLMQEMNNVWGFDPRKWEGHSCLVKELSVEDCIKEGLAAVERKQVTEREKQREETNQITQMSLFGDL